MGCTTSCISPSVAELNKSVKTGDERTILLKLAACPKLLSTTTTVLSSTGLTPLHQACESKQVKVVQQIFSFISCSSLETVREALLPYCRRVGRPLPTSVAEGIRLVVDMNNSKGQTPLMYACFADCPELVKLLLSNGADPWIGDRCGRRTALHYAAMGGSSACIQTLMKHIPPRLITRQGVRYVDARSLCGLTPLHYCAYFGNLEALRELLHHFDPELNAMTTSESYDVSVTCEPRSSPLHFAAVAGNEEAAREVLKYFAQHRNRAAADPRSRMNAAGQLPWQVALAHHPAALSLASLLHPGQPLERLLGVGSSLHGGTSGGLGLGPSPLAAIAAAALRTKLLAELHGLRDCADEGEDWKTTDRAAETAMGGVDSGGGEVGAVMEAAMASATRTSTVASAALVPIASSVCYSGTAASLPNCYPECSPAGWERAADAATSAASAKSMAPATTTAPAASTATAGCASSGATTGAIATAGCSGSPFSCCRGLWDSGQSSSAQCCCSSALAGGEAALLGGDVGASHDGLLKQPSGRQHEKEEEEEDGLQCGVCFAARVAVSPAGCYHGLCTGCAEQLCGGVTRRPLNCPFCRRVVTGFVRLPPPQGA